MKVPDNKEIANHIVPESCVVRREAYGEALTGVCTGQPLSREIMLIRVPTWSQTRKATWDGAKSRVPTRPDEVREPGMYIRSLPGNREISCPTAASDAVWRSASGR